MSDIATFQQVVKFSRDFMEGTLKDLTDQQAHWCPPGPVMAIAGQYAHVIAAQDMILTMSTGKPPLASAAWAGKTGLSTMPPNEPDGPLLEWSRGATIDMPALRGYAQAVYGAVDEFLASAGDSALQKPVDLSAYGFGEQPALFILTAALVGNVNAHCGEISCLKGLQDSKGYPL